jgi:hypothetical protein
MRYSKIFKDTVRSLCLQGFRLGQIQEETKVSKATIRLWIGDIVFLRITFSLKKSHTSITTNKGNSCLRR